jgi:hypothetical protein
VLCSNRDEYLERPTTLAHFHSFDKLEEHSHLQGNVLSGVDVRAGGTWLGVNRTGRVAFLSVPSSPDCTPLTSFFLTEQTSQKSTKRMVLPGVTSLPIFFRQIRKRTYTILFLAMLNMQALIYYSCRRPPVANTTCNSMERMSQTMEEEERSLSVR